MTSVCNGSQKAEARRRRAGADCRASRREQVTDSLLAHQFYFPSICYLEHTLKIELLDIVFENDEKYIELPIL